MSFAPILQNNPTGILLDYVTQWAGGTGPDETGFVVFGKEDKKDRSHYTPAIELYGFLNLHLQPFYNSAASAYDPLAHPDDKSVLSRVRRMGEKTRAFLSAHPGMVQELAGEFRTAIRALDPTGDIPMEGISNSKVAEEYAEEREKQVDVKFSRLISERALAKADLLRDSDAAATFFHIMLDAVTYHPETKSTGDGKHTLKPVPLTTITGVADVELPLPLAGTANDALGYLRGGFHVLLAGAPGTGKTTLAQLVGHAWNAGLAQVQTR